MLSESLDARLHLPPDCFYIKLRDKSNGLMTPQDSRVETLRRRGGRVTDGAGVGLPGASNVEDFFLDLGADYVRVFIL